MYTIARALSKPIATLVVLYLLLSWLFPSWPSSLPSLALLLVVAAICASWASFRVMRGFQTQPLLAALAAVPIAFLYLAVGNGWLAGALEAPGTEIPQLKFQAGLVASLWSAPLAIALGWVGASWSKRRSK
jgi:hypothetical protein